MLEERQPEHDLALLAGLDAITGLGFPVLVGASRKRFLGALLATADSRLRPPDQRDSATLATSVLAARAGGRGVRVHDWRAAWTRSGWSPPSPRAHRHLLCVRRDTAPDRHLRLWR